ncbi:MAG: flavin-containing monooxygenase [Acidimicrobiia bacterium]
MTDIGEFDQEAVRRKYLAERDKRLVAGRAAIRDLTTDEVFARYKEDPFTPVAARAPVVDDIDVAIVGGGMAGVVAGAELRKAGVANIRIIDKAGGIGGTWYWNRYPGVMCDVESYQYLPMLEEMNYVPTTRYAFGDEIRRHLEAIAQRFDLVGGALFHTGIETAEWDEAAARWRIRTDRGDELTARYVVMAVGILNLMKLPVIEGMETFKGRSFHTARWDYSYTGGSPSTPMTKLADKRVAIIGTGASAVQCIPPLAESAQRLYVFQRTPSAVGFRGNRPTSQEFIDSLTPGWQRARMENFQAIMLGLPVEVDLTDDGWTHHFGPNHHPPRDPSWSIAEYMRHAEEFDYRIMEEHRRRVDETVLDKRTAEILKPYYRYLCRRPCFLDEYYPAFNRDNVTLIDCPAGIERVNETGLVVNGDQYDVDLIVYATGFEAEATALSRRAGCTVIGRGGVTLVDKWSSGAASLYGMMTHGFPNLFVMPAPGQQAVVTVNHTLITVEGAEHIGATVALLEKSNVRSFDVNADAEDAWVKTILSSWVDGSSVMSACTPSRINNEGHPELNIPQNGSYGGGLGDFFGFKKLLREWRERADFAGLDVETN